MCFEVATMASSVCLEIITTSSSPATDEESDTQFLISTANTNWDKQQKISSTKSNNCELVDYQSLPEFLKHNEFILDHYRSEWPLKQTIYSIFSLHNESLNIWTHLIGFFIFLILTTHAASIFPVAAASISISNPSSSPQSHSGNSSNTLPPLSSPSPPQQQLLIISRWPFYLYLSGVMFCLLMSSCCHLLCCHSAATCYLTLRLDYAGISALIVSSFYPLVYYTFACLPFIRNLYLCFITLFGFAAVAAALAPAFEAPRFRAARSALFACMAASGIVPIAHKMVAFGDRPAAVASTGYEVLMGVFYGIGVVVYGVRVPERWLPGKFDLAGNSHQLFHVLVVAGAYAHYLASVVYVEWREAEGC